LTDCGVEHPVVVGLSMGGLVAMEMVTANPDRYSGAEQQFNSALATLVRSHAHS